MSCVHGSHASQVVEAKHAIDLLSESPEGFGYMLQRIRWRS
jgi:hypothetical protein